MVGRSAGLQQGAPQGFQQGRHLVSPLRDRPRRGGDRLLRRDRSLRHGQVPPEGREGRLHPHLDHHPLDPPVQHGRGRPPRRDLRQSEDVRRRRLRDRHHHEVPGGVRNEGRRIHLLRDPLRDERKGAHRHPLPPALRDRRRPPEDRVHLQGPGRRVRREGQHRMRPHRPRIRSRRLRDRKEVRPHPLLPRQRGRKVHRRLPHDGGQEGQDHQRGGHRLPQGEGPALQHIQDQAQVRTLLEVQDPHHLQEHPPVVHRRPQGQR